MIRPPITTLFLTSLCATWLLAAPLAKGANFVNLSLAELNDALFPSTTHGLDVQVVIPDVTGVSGVNLTLGDGTTVLALEDVGSGTWISDEAFTSIGNAQSVLDGSLWEIDILGSSPSTTEFSFVTPTMGFFTPPTITNPTNGATGVPQNVTFTWVTSSGVGASDFLFVFAGNDVSEQQNANVLGGSLSINDEQWTPLPLAGGLNEFDVLYVTPSTGVVGAFNITSGTITWSDSPLDSSGAPIDPGFGIGGSTTIGFTVVPEPSTFGLGILALAGMGFAAGRRRVPASTFRFTT